MASSSSKRVPWSFPRITNSDGTMAVPHGAILEPVRHPVAKVVGVTAGTLARPYWPNAPTFSGFADRISSILRINGA